MILNDNLVSKMEKHRWTEREDKIAFYAYKFLSDAETNKKADTLPMSNASFLMRIQNFRFLDSGKGLGHYSKQSKRIYEKYRTSSKEDLELVLSFVKSAV